MGFNGYAEMGKHAPRRLVQDERAQAGPQPHELRGTGAVARGVGVRTHCDVDVRCQIVPLPVLPPPVLVPNATWFGI
jgi:hypothetical protein